MVVKNELDRARLFDILGLVVITLLTHWMLLVNEGIYAEDWGLFPALKYSDWDAFKDVFWSSGVPTSILYFWPLSLFVNTLFFKAINFSLIILGSIFVYLIGLKTRFLNRSEAFWIAVLCIVLPIYKVYVISTYYYYIAAYVVFLSATYVYLKMNSASHGWSRLLLRIVSLFLYAFSFNISSLLVFYFSALALFYAVYRQSKQAASTDFSLIFKDIIGFIKSNLDFFVLPFVYWIAKQIFTPTSGLYSNYNGFNISFASFTKHVVAFIINGVWMPISDSLFLLLIISAGIVIVCAFLPKGVRRSVVALKSDGIRDSRRSRQILIFGILLLFAAIFPYALVGKAPEPGVLMRHALLISLPMGVILVGLYGLLRERLKVNRKIAYSLVGIFIVCLQFGWWQSYIPWQARWVKDQSVTLYLESNPNWSNYDIYWIEDKFLIDGVSNEYGFADYTARFRMLWGGQTRMAFTPEHEKFFGVESARGEKPVKVQYMERIRYFCNSWASAKDIDLVGSQAVLKIEPGEAQISNLKLAVSYWYYRFFKPANLQSFLHSVVKVSLTALP
jgi:hypothetical protein